MKIDPIQPREGKKGVKKNIEDRKTENMSFSATLKYVSSHVHVVTSKNKNDQANDDFELGNRIILPAELLEPLLQQDFRPAMNLVLTSRATMLRCYVGVKEFSAPPGRIILPSSVVEALGLTGSVEDSEIVVRPGKARAATQLSLRSLNELGEVNIEAFLTEALPRQYVVIQKGQVLKFKYDDDDAVFIVTDFKPEGVEAVMLVDTNVALDVETCAVSDASSSLSRALSFGVETEGMCSSSSTASYFSVIVPDVSSTAVKVSVRSEMALPDIYLSYQVKKPTASNHGWLIPGRKRGGSTSLILSADTSSFPEDTDSFQVSNTLYLTATSKGIMNEDFKFFLSVETIQLELGKSTGTTLTGAFQPDSNIQLCPNCRANVPTSSFSLHSLSCSRNNVRCDHPSCGAILRKGTDEANNHRHCKDCSKIILLIDQERHSELWHNLHSCESGCGKKSSLNDLHFHSRFECRFRKILCRFCNLLVRAGPAASSPEDRDRGLTSHEADVCGVKTKICTLCKPLRSIPRKQFDEHLTVHHPSAIAARSSAQNNNPTSDMIDTAEEIVSFNTEKQWRCRVCTVINEIRLHHCSVCGSEDTERLGSVSIEQPSSPVGIASTSVRNQSIISSSNEDFNMATTTAPDSEVRRPCANSTCGARVVFNFSDSVTIRRTLCSRCYSLVCTPPASAPATLEFYNQTGGSSIGYDDDAATTQIMRVLQIRYEIQVDIGCGNQMCRNSGYCATARRHSSINKETELAQLLSESMDGRFHVCVLENAKFVPTVPTVTPGTNFAATAPIGKKAAAGKKTIGAAFFP